MGKLRSRSKAEPVEFEATDGVVLNGLLYEPSTTTKSAAIFLHGNGGDSIFATPYLNAVIAAAGSSEM